MELTVAGFLRFLVAFGVYPLYKVLSVLMSSLLSDVSVSSAIDFIVPHWDKLGAWVVYPLAYLVVLTCYSALWALVKLTISYLFQLVSLFLQTVTSVFRMSDAIAGFANNLQPSGEKVVRLPSITESNVFKPEAMVPGSDFHDMRQPAFQCGLFSVGKQSRAVGHAVRIDSWLIAPTHVLQAGPLEAVVVRNGVKVVAPVGEDWTEVCPDISATRISSNFPLKGAVVGPINSTMATVVASEPHSGSVGRIKEDDFDALVYSGSTRPGHSGCAYVQSGKVVGIHLGSTAGVNMGYVATYIKSRLHPLSPDFVTESSDYVYLAKLSQKQLRELSFRSTGDPDEWEVKYQGRYFRLSARERQDLEEVQDRLENVEFEQTMNLIEGEGEGAVAMDAHWRREREALDREVRSLRDRIARFEALLPQLADSSPVQSTEDPVPEYQVSENLLRGFRDGTAWNPESRITVPTLRMPAMTSTASQTRRSPLTMVGQTQTPKPSPGVLRSTQKSEKVVAPTQGLSPLRRRKKRSSRSGTTPTTQSRSPSPASISTLTKGSKTSSTPSAR